MSAAVKKIIQMFIHNFMTSRASGKPLAAVIKELAFHGISRFPGAVHAVASKAKSEIERGCYRGPRYDRDEMLALIAAAQAEPASGASLPYHPPTLGCSSFSGSADEAPAPEPAAECPEGLDDECGFPDASFAVWDLDELYL